MFAGLGTNGHNGDDLRKRIRGSLVGIGTARRSCGRPAGVLTLKPERERRLREVDGRAWKVRRTFSSSRTGCELRDGEEPLLAWHTLELVTAAILKLQS